MTYEITKTTPSGKYIKIGKSASAFVPNELPVNIEFTNQLVSLLSEAERYLGVLTGSVGEMLKHTGLQSNQILKVVVRKESASTTRIEGTNISEDEIYLDKIVPTITKKLEKQEALNYEKALEYGSQRIKEGYPISYRLITKLHKILLIGTKDENKTPGEFRKNQNYVGSNKAENATYIPPPVPEMKIAFDNWEKYLNDESAISPVLKSAILHYQFEAIHPFLDGNGRIGRLITNLYLESSGYSGIYMPMSEFFEKYKSEYYERLNSVSKQGGWDAWITFYLKGIIDVSKSTKTDLEKISMLYKTFRDTIDEADRVPANTDRLIKELFDNPFVNINWIRKRWNVPYTSVKRIVDKLVEVKILIEIKDQTKGKLKIPKNTKIYINGDLLLLMVK